MAPTTGWWSAAVTVTVIIAAPRAAGTGGATSVLARGAIASSYQTMGSRRRPGWRARSDRAAEGDISTSFARSSWMDSMTRALTSGRPGRELRTHAELALSDARVRSTRNEPDSALNSLS